MTALDQAFIKAYMHHGGTPVAATLSSAKPVRLAEALGDAPQAETAESPPETAADSRAVAVAAALEKAPVRPRASTSRPRPEASESPRRSTKSGATSKSSSSARRGKSSESPLAASPAAKPRATSPQSAKPEPVKPEPTKPLSAKVAGTPLLEGLGIPASALPARTASSEKVAVEAEIPKPVEVPETVAVPEPAPASFEVQPPEHFQPAFQVDRFLWAQGCTRLSAAAAEQLDRLAEGITNRQLPGQRVVGMCGCRRGDGCTTLLMCVARRLAAQGRRVMLIDANFEQPMLARRLGLLPEMGWEDVLWRGVPMAEASIESLEDRLTLLPLRGGLPAGTDGEVAPAADMALLRRHFDLVLVDLGRFDLASSQASAVYRSARHWIDAVVVVHNVRTTPQSELDYVRRWLQELGLSEAGIAENFV